MNRIFISHKQEDQQFASNISSHLNRNGIATYLDVLDVHLLGDGEELTEYLRSKLDQCTHLLAVLSEKTQLSWWVPFEIGLATEKDYPISSFTNLSKIPDYLWKWPVLRHSRDLDVYIDNLNKGREIIITEAYGQFSVKDNKTYAKAFHSRLKRELRG